MNIFIQSIICIGVILQNTIAYLLYWFRKEWKKPVPNSYL